MPIYTNISVTNQLDCSHGKKIPRIYVCCKTQFRIRTRIWSPTWKAHCLHLLIYVFYKKDAWQIFLLNTFHKQKMWILTNSFSSIERVSHSAIRCVLYITSDFGFRARLKINTRALTLKSLSLLILKP